MRIIKLMGMVLMSVLMCANFSACSEDDSGNGNDDGKKRIKKVVETDNNGTTTYECVYTYDGDGRLIAATETYNEEGEKFIDIYQYCWTDGSIIITGESWSEHNGSASNSQTYSSTLILEGGLLQSIIDGYSTRTVTYNKDRIARIDINVNGTKDLLIRLNWNNDKLLSTQGYDRDVDLTYGVTCNKGFFPMMGSIIDGNTNDALFNAHPELIGAYSNKLPTKMKNTSSRYEEENYTLGISYTFNNDGYISTAKMVADDGEVSSMTFTWK